MKEKTQPAETVQASEVYTEEPQSSGRRAVKIVFRLLYAFRKVVLALPVIFYALKLAAYNTAHLPDPVGIGLTASGTFTYEVAKAAAVTGPLCLTLACLLMMFFSRKALHCWAVSVFTLAVPLVLLISNIYPA